MTHTITGKLILANGRPSTGVKVQAFFKTPKKEEKLTEPVETYFNGFYTISYKPKPKGNHIFIKVLDAAGTGVLAQSQVHINAPEKLELNVQLPEGIMAGLTEFEAIEAGIKSVLGNTEIISFTSEEINILSADTGIPSTRLFIYQNALSIQQKYPDLLPRVIYALLHNRNEIIEADDLFNLSIEEYTHQIQEAVDHLIINAIEPRNARNQRNKYQEIRIRLFIQKPVYALQANMELLWNIGKIPANLHPKLATIYLDGKGSVATFYKKISEDTELKVYEEPIRLLIGLNNLTIGNLPFVGVLFANKAVKTIENLARWSHEMFQAQLLKSPVNGNVPPEIEGKNNAEKQFNYIRAIRRMLEHLYPTQALAGNLFSDGDLPQPLKSNFTTFFRNNPEFRFDKESIASYLRKNKLALKDIDNSVEFVKELKAYGVCFSITPVKDRYQHITKLRKIETKKGKTGIHSSMEIAHLGYSNFMQKYTALGASIQEAEYIFSMVQHLGNKVQSVLMFERDFSHLFYPFNKEITNDPVWKNLFGSEDYCQCTSCKSVYSPAAYLTDLLHFLQNRKLENDQSAYDVFMKRRPDIRSMLLNCENAHTAMPYIDLVNEVLENAVEAIEHSRNNNTEQPFTHNTTRTTPELNALPEYVNENVYKILKTETYPWNLPFDFYTEMGRIYLQHLGMDQTELSRKFKKSNVHIAFNQIGLSPLEEEIFREGSYENSALRFWNIDSLDKLIQIPILLAKAGITYQELNQLLQTKFINADGHLKIDLKGKCDIDIAELTGSTHHDFKQIFLFRKLQLVLGVSIEETDHILFAVLEKYNQWDRNDNRDFFRYLGNIIEFHQKHKLPIHELCTWFGNMPTSYINTPKNQHTLYEKIFLQKSLDQPAQIKFILNENKVELAVPIVLTADIKAFIASAVYMDVKDVELICNYFHFEKLKLKELSIVFGINSLCKKYVISIGDYLYIRKSLGIPLTSPVYVKSIIEIYELLQKNNIDIQLVKHLTQTETIDVYKLSEEKIEQAKKELQLTKDKYQQPGYSNDTTTTSFEELLIKKLGSIFGIQDEVIKNIIPEDQQWSNILWKDHAFINDVQHHFKVIHNISLLLDKLNLSKKGEIALTEHRELNFSINDQPIEFKKLISVCYLKQVWQKLYDPEFGFVHFLANIPAGNAYSEKVAIYTLMPKEDIEILAGIAAETEIEKIAYYLDIKVITEKLGVEISKDFNQLSSLCNHELTGKDIEFISQLAKSKYGEEQWLGIAKKLRNPIREKQRDVLATYIVHHHPLEKIKSNDDLYSHYLMDVDMSSCMQSSRILLAISSTQLFIQRCLMNLEPEVNQAYLNKEATRKLYEAELKEWEEWKWRKNYRVWEANRKVFLYPENWLEPAWRDDKTPFFKELEEELMQNELTNDSAERAYLNYLNKLDEVSNLEIVAMCKGDENGSYFIFGRTNNEPQKYFFRKFTKISNQFSPWERIELDIQGKHISPFFHKNKLYLFWANFRKNTERGERIETETGFVEQEGIDFWEIRIEWSEYKNGTWSSKGICNDSLKTPLGYNFVGYPTLEKMLQNTIITTCQKDENILINCYLKDITGVHSYPYDEDLGSFIFAPHNKQMAIKFDLSSKLTLFRPSPQSLSFTLINHKFIKSTRFDKAVRINEIELARKEYAPSQLIQLVTIFQVFDNTISANFYNHPFVYQDNYQIFLVIGNTTRYRLTPLNYHLSQEILENVHIHGLKYFLNNYYKESDLFEVRNRFLNNYDVVSENVLNIPVESFETDIYQANSDYNWELFFHIPMLIANKLSQDQRFEEAQQWYHSIFDPTVRSDDETIERFWKFKPFREFTGIKSIAEILYKINEESQNDMVDEYEATLQEWEQNPFNPHLVARNRIIAYMKNVVMKYVDNLIAWADHLFKQDTMENLNEATQIYMLAWNLIGPKPTEVKTNGGEDKNFQQLDEDGLDDFSNSRFPYVESFIHHTTNRRDDEPKSGEWVIFNPGGKKTDNERKEVLDKFNKTEVVLGQIYFAFYYCLPPNAKLLGYWDLLKDRFFKLRNCRNIAGVQRQLPLYEPPIDPGLLIRAKQLGISITEIIDGSIYAENPHYRFTFMVAKAVDYANDVRFLGNALLNTIEKKEGEIFSQLRVQHELKLSAAITDIKKKQIKELKEGRKAMEYSLNMANKRWEYYSSKEFMNSGETTQMVLMGLVNRMQLMSQVASMSAATQRSLPDFQVGVSGLGAHSVYVHGGTKIGDGSKDIADGFGTMASILNITASEIGQMSSYERRYEDWQHQANVSIDEVEQIQKQILAADIRIAIAEKELENHLLQIEQSKEQEEFIQNKFTNKELYGWMESQLKSFYFQSYQMAFDMAKKAEKALCYELGENDETFINYGYWDNLRTGLLSGDKLYHDLKRMDMAYLERNKRLHEVSKTVSMGMLNATELVKLRATGNGKLNIMKFVFDLDFPYHTNRKIKSVSITIPCVAGPYTGVHCTLSSGIHSIATSTAQNDSGVFQFNFNDERYLPFEGLRIGDQIEFNIELNGEYKSFDYNSITDVLLHINYTAETSSEKATIPELNLSKLISLKNEFSAEWYEVKNGKDIKELKLDSKHLPYVLKSTKNLEINVKIAKVKPPTEESASPIIEFETESGVAVNDMVITFEDPINNSGDLMDIWLIVDYTI